MILPITGIFMNNVCMKYLNALIFLYKINSAATISTITISIDTKLSCKNSDADIINCVIGFNVTPAVL